jgi:Fic family protein
MRLYETTHPWLTFSINLAHAPAKLWALLGESNSICQTIAGIPLHPDIQSDLLEESLREGSIPLGSSQARPLTREIVNQFLSHDELSPSERKYSSQESDNIVEGFKTILKEKRGDGWRDITPEILKEYNLSVLNKLVVSEKVISGEFRKNDYTGSGRQGIPVSSDDCEFLLERLCMWLNGKTFTPPPGMAIMYGILRAIVAHIYLVWIRPFGDGNLRTTKLVEFDILVSSGVPAPSAPLLNLHYTMTRSEYYRHMDIIASPDGKILPFLMYAVQGFRENLSIQLSIMRDLQADNLWNYYIHQKFIDKTSPSDIRKRELALEISRLTQPVLTNHLMETIPRLAKFYVAKTYKTLTRDIQELTELQILEKTESGIITKKKCVRAFLKSE